MTENFLHTQIKNKFKDETSVFQLNPLVLASIGDGVYSLYMRTYLVSTHDFNAHKLHSSVAGLVRASAQKKAYCAIEDKLSDGELYVAKRGRNSHPGTIPKNADMHDYRMATALEAVFGYLYLLERHDRIDELIRIILEKENEKTGTTV